MQPIKFLMKASLLSSLILTMTFGLDALEPVEVLDALVQAYPERIMSVGIRNGDWSVVVNEELFYWAEGRLLPEDERDQIEKYQAYSFWPYPKELPPLPELSPQEIEALQRRIEIREQGQDGRNNAFLIALWGMGDKSEAEDTVEIRRFLGRNIRIHPGIQEPLNRVETIIRKKAEFDPELKAWIAELSSTGGYVWRGIAGSGNRSLHSFGIAVDLVPKDYGGRAAYWRWSRAINPKWWAIPYEDRFMIPQAVIQAFEDNGFIWGGKWFLFDQIHFEYRPELIILGETPSSRDELSSVLKFFLRWRAVPEDSPY